MTEFFNTISAFFDFCIGTFETVGALLGVVGKAFGYIMAIVVLLPEYFMGVVMVFVVVAVVYMVLNWS